MFPVLTAGRGERLLEDAVCREKIAALGVRRCVPHTGERANRYQVDIHPKWA